jgi:hypothetical protein
MTKYHKQRPQLDHPQKGIKLTDIPHPNAVIDPRAVMIVPIYARSAYKAMELVFLFVPALGTKRQL